MDPFPLVQLNVTKVILSILVTGVGVKSSVFGQKKSCRKTWADVTLLKLEGCHCNRVRFRSQCFGLKLSDRKGMPISNLVMHQFCHIFGWNDIWVDIDTSRWHEISHMDMSTCPPYFFFRKVRGSILALMSIISTAGHFSSVGYGGWTHHLGYGNFFWIPKISKDLVGWLRRNTRFGRAQSNMSSWLRFLFVLFEGLKVVPMILEDDCSEPRHGVTATQITYSVAGFSELDLEI